MSLSKTTNTYNRQNWEDSDFPIVCETCLGDSPYLRMTKEKYGKECEVCARPFTVFRWCPGARMRFKKTEICQTCARLRNACQTCLLDLEYGLPLQVRDAALKIKEQIPKSDVNKEYFVQNMDSELAKMDEAGGKCQNASDVLAKMARKAPYYERNRPHICSFWVKGECRRGEECPYRHERPTDPEDPLSNQNFKDRYYGVNDPVAEKMMNRASEMPKLEKPEDQTITTLYVGNLNDITTEKDLRDVFYQYGEIRNITHVAHQNCAFIQYTTRAAAEIAAESTYGRLMLGGQKLNVRWGHAQARKDKETTSLAAMKETKMKPMPGLPAPLPPLPTELQNNFFNIAPQTVSVVAATPYIPVLPTLPHPGMPYMSTPLYPPGTSK